MTIQTSTPPPEEFEEEEVFVFPASFAQQRLWFLDQLEPGSPFYNIPSAFRISGKLDVAALEDAFNEIIARHETLRTIFANQDGQPVQVISLGGSISLPLVDLQGLPRSEWKEEAQHLANQEARRPFDLTRGPLFRATLIRFAPEEHMVLITMHHIISDGWSIGVLVGEITTLYHAFSQGLPSPLPDLPVQYADFAAWQQQHLSGKVLEEQLSYWKSQLSDDLPILELPTDRPRPAVQSFRGATHSLVISAEITEKLRTIGQREGATLFMTLLAAFNMLLYRHTGQEDITIGTPIANRNRVEIEPLIGFFVNTLVLRADLSGEPTFREMLRRVKETTMSGYAHQDLPFESIVDALHPSRDLSYNPLFQVMFILQNAPAKAAPLSGVTFEMVDPETGTSTFDLTLSISEMVNGMNASIEYSTDLFDANTIVRLFDHFQVLLEGIIANPDAPITQLGLLTKAERRQLLVDFNSNLRQFPGADLCVHQIFEQRAKETPDAVAVVWTTTELRPEHRQEITYGELNARANQLAHSLRRLGVQPETPVGIILERSIEMPVAVMAVLKSGGAYLPIDPTYPSDRLAFVLEDSRVSILLTQQRLVDSLDGFTGRVICLDSGWDEIAAESCENLDCASKPDQLAYLIYTSGSTGKPKGTMVRHRGLTNNYFAWEEAYELHNNRSHLQMANFAFDVFSADYARALCSGGKLVLCPREFLLVPQQLYALMLQEQIEIAEFVPAVLRNLIQYMEKSGQDLSFMRALVCGSDVWYAGEYKEFLCYCGPQTRLINSFGLTEATIDSSFYEARDMNIPADQHVPIGRPLANTVMYVLDKYLQPLPIGVHGELFVGGPCIARGYLNRTDLTAEKFIDNPNWNLLGIDIPGSSRMYKTGDMARFLPDGNIEFLGRMDYQVKIRGFRIEIGEIESVLRQHLAVRDAVVIAAQAPRPDGGTGPVQQRLAAYLVADLTVDRVPLNVKCQVAEDGNGSEPSPDDPPIQMSTADLSYSGVCLINVPKSWQVNQNLRLRLPLPGLSDPLDIHAVIQWRMGQDAGLMFKASQDQQALLRKSIKFISENGVTNLTDLRRADPRVPLRSACTVEFEDGTTREMVMENLSRGGMRLAGEPDMLQRGRQLHLRLTLPETGQTPWLNGVVWWQKDDRAGIKFDISVGEQAMLEQVVESILHSQGFSLSHLRAFLKSKLPDYMVPSAFVMLDSLPLTHNGKIDRKALPAPDWSSRDWEEEFIAPRTPVEEMLAGVWSQILGVEKIGAFDNFFELGGHSLLATQLVSRIRDTFQVDLPLRAIFECPTLSSLAEQLEIARRSSGGLPATPITLVARDRTLPLSFAQQRLWFMDQYQPNSPFYNLFDGFRLKGPLDPAMLERTLNDIVRRHEILRTYFLTENGLPRQVIVPSFALPLPLFDLSSLGEEQREEQAMQLVRNEVQTPFALARLPLLRATLVRMASDDHIVLLTMHHIIGDDWSSRVLISEISALYQAYAAGQPNPLPPLNIQYADFAAWQRTFLSGETLQVQLDYWRSQLSGLPPLLELPTDHPRPAVQSFNGAYLPFRLSPATSTALKNLSQREGATLFMTLLAVFEALLARYSGQLDFAVGSPIANRNRADIENLIGFFVNTLVLRADLYGSPSFRALLKRARETALGAYAHQDLPFEMLVDALQPERKLSHNPLFQVMFVLQNAPIQAQEMQGVDIAPLDTHSGTAKFDLTLFMLEEGDHLAGVFEYNCDLFEADTITRLIGHFQNLVEAAVAKPDTPVERLPILSQSELCTLIHEWNDTRAGFPAHLCAHQLIEAQIDRTPGAPALSFRDTTLTFAQVEARANQVARLLISLEVGPDTLVGLCLPRSPEMVIAILGILKAGAAYVPIDPSSPPDRVAYILQDAAAPLLLTNSALAERLSPFLSAESPTRSLCVDTDAARIDAMPTIRPDCTANPENLAYVIYTSGSTGRPKGAMILHRGLVNYFTWVQKAYPLAEGNGAPVQSSISFDLTVTSLFAPLLSGGCVALVEEELGVEALGKMLAERGDFSLVKITPAHLGLLSEQIPAALAASRTRAFIIGGENLLPEHIAFWLKHAPGTQLVNEYGPTETVVGCCCYWVPEGSAPTGVIPIGKPILNTRLYILDAQLQPTPIGVPGELYIAGEGVARGYLNRPDLTAERFLLDPFFPGERMYKTGDLCRYRPDGNIECLGRIDFQVKIRGFRVELGEIEAVLGAHPGVKEAVAWTHDDGPTRRLVAYLVPADPANPPSQSELREFLREKLPDHMVPAVFMILDAMPLASSGKIDRKALPALNFATPELQAAYAPPTTRNEETLAAIWRQVLNQPQVGIHDNFFELGGDSILSIQVVARANQSGLGITPKQLFEFPTIAELAAVAGERPIIQAEQGPVTGPVALTPIQHWFFEQHLPAAHHWNQSLLLQPSQPLGRLPLEQAVRALFNHHDTLRTRFIQTGECWQATIEDPSDAIPLEWIDLAAISEEMKPAAIEEHCARLQASLDLHGGPLGRVVAFDLGPGKPGLLLLVFHHLVVDGISWRILIEDLLDAYQQAAQGKEPLLPSKTTSFQLWASRLAEYAQSDATLREIEGWLEQTGADEHPLPVDLPGGANTEGSIDSISISLDEGETRALLQEVHAAYHTDINDLLLAALAIAFQRWTGHPDLLVDMEGHGREDLFPDIDISRTVGWFTTLYPIRLTAVNDNPGETIKSIKENLRRIPDHGLSYGLLRYLTDEGKERLGKLPHAAVTFNYLGQMGGGLQENAQIEMAAESRGPERSPNAPRTALIDINGAVAGGRLNLEWSYNRNLHRAATIQALADDYLRALRQIIQHCLSPDAGGYTTSDFKDFGWGDSDLSDILGEIEEKGKKNSPEMA